MTKINTFSEFNEELSCVSCGSSNVDIEGSVLYNKNGKDEMHLRVKCKECGVVEEQSFSKDAGK